MKTIVLFFLLMNLVACGGKTPTTSQPNFPPNIRMFQGPYSKVWKALTETLRIDYLMNLEIADEKKGRFSSELIREIVGTKSKYRISGTVNFDGQSFIVTLYKYQEVEQNGQWKAIPSDLVLEQKILTDVSKKLK